MAKKKKIIVPVDRFGNPTEMHGFEIGEVIKLKIDEDSHCDARILKHTFCEITGFAPKVRIIAGPTNDKKPYFVNLRIYNPDCGKEVRLGTNFCNLEKI